MCIRNINAKEHAYRSKVYEIDRYIKTGWKPIYKKEKITAIKWEDYGKRAKGRKENIGKGWNVLNFIRLKLLEEIDSVDFAPQTYNEHFYLCAIKIYISITTRMHLILAFLVIMATFSGFWQLVKQTGFSCFASWLRYIECGCLTLHSNEVEQIRLILTQVTTFNGMERKTVLNLKYTLICLVLESNGAFTDKRNFGFDGASCVLRANLLTLSTAV